MSERIKNSLVAAGFSDRNVFILPIFTDEERINAPPKFNLRRKYPRFRRIILAVSRLSKEKNVGLAIAVMEEVAKRRAGVGFIVVGDGPELGFLKSRVEERELGESVVLRAGRKTSLLIITAPMFSAYRQLRRVRPGSGGSGLAGRPIVTTDVGIAFRASAKRRRCFYLSGGRRPMFDRRRFEGLGGGADVSLSRVTMADKRLPREDEGVLAEMPFARINRLGGADCRMS